MYRYGGGRDRQRPASRPRRGNYAPTVAGGHGTAHAALTGLRIDTGKCELDRAGVGADRATATLTVA
jgi:hypothetical protein